MGGLTTIFLFTQDRSAVTVVGVENPSESMPDDRLTTIWIFDFSRCC